jgi:hypothetical protein
VPGCTEDFLLSRQSAIFFLFFSNLLGFAGRLLAKFLLTTVLAAGVSLHVKLSCCPSRYVPLVQTLPECHSPGTQYSESAQEAMGPRICVVLFSNVNDIETKRNEASILAFFNIEAKQTLLIQKFLKIQAKRTLLIQELKKIDGKRALPIPDIRKIEAKQTLLTPYNRKTKAKINEMDQSKTNRIRIKSGKIEKKMRFI